MKGFISKVRRIPWWEYVAGIGFFILQRIMYRLGDHLSRMIGTIDNAFVCKIPFIDDLFPVIPVFVVIYLFSFVFWICGPMAVSLTGKRNMINFSTGMFAAYFIGFLFFAFVPTCMDRVAEGLLEIADKPGVFNKLLKVVYDADGREMAFNLMPSYHCLISAYCYLGVRKRKEISGEFQMYSLIMAILICFSTLFTKQHYIIDVILGVAVSIVCYVIIEKIDPGKKFEQ